MERRRVAPSSAPKGGHNFRGSRNDTTEPTNCALWEQALIIGECTTVLARIGATRIARIEQSLGSTSAPTTDADAAGGGELERSESEADPCRDESEAMGLAARDLDRLERYERRALSRRKRAIEMYLAISNTPQSPATGASPVL